MRGSGGIATIPAIAVVNTSSSGDVVSVDSLVTTFSIPWSVLRPHAAADVVSNVDVA